MKEDKDLEFLAYCKNEDLKTLVDYLTIDKDGKPRISESLMKTEGYRYNYPNNLPAMWQEIANEFQLFGGHSLINVVRKQGICYREVLTDVCDRVKVNYHKESDLEQIENSLLQKILIDSLEKMSEEDLKELVDNFNIKTQGFGSQAMLAAVLIAIKNGGIFPYYLAVIVANAASRILLGRGLALATNAALMRYVSMFAGPVGWVITALWTLVDIAGPAYRVTIPCVIQIIYMRRRSQMLLD